MFVSPHPTETGHADMDRRFPAFAKDDANRLAFNLTLPGADEGTGIRCVEASGSTQTDSTRSEVGAVWKS